MNNKCNSCEGRFPRDTQKVTKIDPESGALLLEKHKSQLNTFTVLLAYLLRCNTDTTCLLSGTAIKATIASITDYISKSTLKTHVILESIKTIFSHSLDIFDSDLNSLDKYKMIITRLANFLSGKLEIGATMASMYFLGHLDHYTNCVFNDLYWKSFVDEVVDSGHKDEHTCKYSLQNSTILLYNSSSKRRVYTPINDYIYIPYELSDYSLFQWHKQCQKMQQGNQSRTNEQIDKSADDVDSLITTITKAESKLNTDHNTKYFFLSDHPQKKVLYKSLTSPLIYDP